MSRKLKYDIPGPDWRRSAEDLSEFGLEAAFAPQLRAPLYAVVEIGFGRGEFLIEMAERHPERAYLGIEISFKRVLKMARRVAIRPIENMRLVNSRGEFVVGDLLPRNSLRELWINFPDPWPKKRQSKNRVVQPAFVEALVSRLQPGGLLYVATDDRPYAEQIDEVLSDEPLLENRYWPLHWKPEVPGRPMTAYEREWRAVGRPLHFFEYRRRS